jgi:Domain of unknown function (DUF4157)
MQTFATRNDRCAPQTQEDRPLGLVRNSARPPGSSGIGVAPLERPAGSSWHFSRISVHAPVGPAPVPLPAPGLLQRKLMVGRTDDPLEREADRVAERVVEMPEAPGVRTPAIRVRGVAGAERVDAGAPPTVYEALASPAKALDPATRAFMESRFGYDFGQVRVHTDAKAAESARAVNSLAYTVRRDVVFGAGQYRPGSAEGRLLLGHELAHTIQQTVGTQTLGLAQRSPELPLGAYGIFNLRNNLKTLADDQVKDYVTYRNTISQAANIETIIALSDRELLNALRDILDHVAFARCVESLGRRAPTFDELRKTSRVQQAIDEAWKASDVGVRDLVTQPHEEGGWVFLNLIDGSLSIERARAQGANFITLNPAPSVADSVVVAVFHTHPFVGGPRAKPSARDKLLDKRDGVPDLVAANTGTDPASFRIYLSGPAVRKHLASDTQFPGPSGGIAP